MSVVYFLFQQTMYFTIPLLIVAIGGLFSERSGVTNVALDGIMIFGAFWGILFLKHAQKVIPGQGVLLLALLIAGISGAAFSLLHAYASINMKANQVISGTALNIFAPAFAVYITRSIQKVQQITFEDQFLIQKVPILGSIPVIV
jgi:simple sugar transport system permease protein